MQDFAALLDSHICERGCSRRTHTQSVLVSPADVASAAAEIGILSEVRDRLGERDLRMLEGEPTPRFGPGPDTEPKSWEVRFETQVPARRRTLFRRG